MRSHLTPLQPYDQQGFQYTGQKQFWRHTPKTTHSYLKAWSVTHTKVLTPCFKAWERNTQLQHKEHVLSLHQGDTRKAHNHKTHAKPNTEY